MYICMVANFMEYGNNENDTYVEDGRRFTITHNFLIAKMIVMITILTYMCTINIHIYVNMCNVI